LWKNAKGPGELGAFFFACAAQGMRQKRALPLCGERAALKGVAVSLRLV